MGKKIVQPSDEPRGPGVDAVLATDELVRGAAHLGPQSGARGQPLDRLGPLLRRCGQVAGPPVLDQLASEYAKRAKIAKLNVDQNSITASQYAIRSTPSLFFFKGGKLLERVLGALPKGEIERHLLAIL